MLLLFFNSVLTLSASSKVKRPSLEAVSCSFETNVLFVPLSISDSFWSIVLPSYSFALVQPGSSSVFPGFTAKYHTTPGESGLPGSG